jgi:GntR family transcriptional repressor for pyruvate dehydrogenase complex
MRLALDGGSAFVEADVEFHALIAAASGNMLFDRLSATYASLIGASFALQARITPRNRMESETLPTHTAVYRAIASRDPVAARRSMEVLVAGAQAEVRSIVVERSTTGPHDE